MADLSIQDIGGDGGSYTTSAANSGGDALPMSGEDTVVLLLENDGSSSSDETVTLTSQASKLSIGQAASDEAVTVPNGGRAAVWVEKTNYFEMLDGDEKVQLSYSTASALQVAAIRQ